MICEFFVFFPILGGFLLLFLYYLFSKVFVFQIVGMPEEAASEAAKRSCVRIQHRAANLLGL